MHAFLPKKEGVHETRVTISVSARPATGPPNPDLRLDFTGTYWSRLGHASIPDVTEAAEEIERRIDRLRVSVRQAVLAGDRERAAALRRELKRAEQAWEDMLTAAEPADDSHPAWELPLLPLREQVHEALGLLTVPAAPKLISTVHEAFFGTGFASAKLTSLRRDEERSFRSAPFARPYYICAALTADLLAPARGLLAISTWPSERRIIGSLSPRVDFLTAAIQVAAALDRLQAPVPAASRLLWRFAASIPGAAQHAEPRIVAAAAMAELSVHEAADQATRKDSASRACGQLDDAGQLFGARLHMTRASTDRSGN
jgi:hypothetical protein